MPRTRRTAGPATAFATLLIAAPAAAEVGALAYSPSTDEYVSVSMNIFTMREVQMKALESCSADDCRIVRVILPGQCVALAVSDKSFGHALGESQAEADERAMANCSSDGQDPNCRILAQQCAKE